MLQVLHELWDFVILSRYTHCDRFMYCEKNMLERTPMRIPTTKRTKNPLHECITIVLDKELVLK